MKKVGLEIERKFKGHSVRILSVLYFGYPFFRLVTCDKTRIKAWDLGKEKNVMERSKKTVSIFSDFLRMIKWNKDHFLCCSTDSNIYSISIRDLGFRKLFGMKKWKKKSAVDFTPPHVVRMLKLNSDEFICLNNQKEIFVISYSQNKILRFLSMKIESYENLFENKFMQDTTPRLLLSKNFGSMSCFYANDNKRSKSKFSGNENSVKLINAQKDEVFFNIRAVANDEKNEEFLNPYIRTMSIFLNHKEEEILVFGGGGGVLTKSFGAIYICNLGQKREIEILTKSKREYLTNKYILRESSLSYFAPIVSTVLDSRYLFLADGGLSSTLRIYDIQTISDGGIINMQKVSKKRIFSADTTCLELIIFANANANARIIASNFLGGLKLISTDIPFLDHKPEKDVFKILNEKIKLFVHSIISKNKYCEFPVAELKRICGEIIKDTLLEYLDIPKNNNNNNNINLEPYEKDIKLIKEYLPCLEDLSIFFKNESVCCLSEFSNDEYSFYGYGKGIEFLKSMDDQKFCLFYSGNYTDGKKDGEGKLFLSNSKNSNFIINSYFLNGTIDIKNSFSEELTKKIEKIQEEILNQEDFLEELVSKEKKSKEEIFKDPFLFAFSNEWFFRVKNLMVSALKDINNLELKLKEMDIQNLLEFRFIQIQKNKNNKNDQFLYYGTTKNKTPDGFGIQFFGKKKKKLSLVYIGGFRDGKREGNGKIFDERTKKMKHRGEFKNGKRDGKGVEWKYIKKDGYNFKVYEGLFKDGKKCGSGRLYDFQKKCYVHGIWEDGRIVKRLKTFRCAIISYGEIERFLIRENIIGSGAFGDIYRVKSSNIKLDLPGGVKIKDNFLAVKVAKVEGTGSLASKLMFKKTKRGIELCSDIEDKTNILETYGIFRSYRGVGCVMKYCKCSIDHVISKGGISLKEKIRYLSGVANGMHYLHKTNTMHRDLKWGNVLIGVDDVIKITDFDTMKEDERRWNLNIQTLTSKVGTPGFSAPEIGLGKKYGLECDVFSFGMMIYSLLFEMNQPYSSQFQCQCKVEVTNMLSINSLHTHVAQCNFRPLLDPKRIKKFPRYLIDLMILCWDKEPSKRPTFKEINQIFRTERKKENIKSYFLVELEFPKHKEFFKNEKLLFVQGEEEKEYYNKLKSFLTTKKYDGSVIKNLDWKNGGIYNNQDMIDLLRREENPLIQVEFSEFNMPEKNEAEKMIEKQRVLEEDNLLLRKRIIELEKKLDTEKKIRKKMLGEEKGKKEFKEQEANNESLFRKFLEEKKMSFDEFTKFCEFQKEETEGEDDKES